MNSDFLKHFDHVDDSTVVSAAYVCIKALSHSMRLERVIALAKPDKHAARTSRRIFRAVRSREAGAPWLLSESRRRNYIVLIDKNVAMRLNQASRIAHRPTREVVQDLRGVDVPLS